MNLLTVSRDMARQGYAAMRHSLTVLDQRVVARYWDERAPLRAGFERFLGSVDEAVGWLLATDDVPGAAAGAGSAPPPARPSPLADTVEVIFTLPAEVEASSVALCGEFNEWSAEAMRLERGDDGAWRAAVALEPGRSYRYRYLLDGRRWENAWQADRYEANPFGSTDSVVVVD